MNFPLSTPPPSPLLPLPPKRQERAVVEWAREAAPGLGIFEMRLRAPEIASAALPGQFVHLRISDGLDPLLRRPFSIGWVEKAGGALDLLYRVVGRGTEILARAKAGDSFDLIGSLGNPFTPHRDRPAALVAGGIGIADLLMLAADLRGASVSGADAKTGSPNEVHLIYGARTARELVWAERFEALGVRVHFATDDGSAGYAGPCTALLPGVIESLASETGLKPAIYACGPEAMFRAILEVIADPEILIQLSFEQRMGCGIGACLACAVKTASGACLRACSEGPVMDGNLFRETMTS